MSKFLLILVLLLSIGCAIAAPKPKNPGIIFQISRCDKPYMMMIIYDDKFNSAYLQNIRKNPALREKMKKLAIEIHQNKGSVLSINLDTLLKMNLCSV